MADVFTPLQPAAPDTDAAASQELTAAPETPAAAPDTQSDTSRFFGLWPSAEERSTDLLRALCSRAAFLALFAYCAYSAAMVVSTCAPLLKNQWDNTYPEAPHVFAALRAAHTGRLYYSFDQPPYVLQSYGPLYYQASAWMARLVHMNIDRYVLLARLAAFVCFLDCGALIFVISRRLKFSAPVSLCAALLPLGVPIFCGWNVTVRPDMYFLALMLAALAAAIWHESPDKWTCMASGALGGAAFLMKQPGLAVLIAIAAVWLLRKEWRRTAWLALGAAAPVVLMLAVLLIHRENFLAQYLSIARAPKSTTDGVLYSISILIKYTLLLPMAIGLVGLVRAIGAGARAQLLAAFAVVNWLIGLSGMPQLGAGPNYFLPGLLGCGLLLPFAVDLVRKKFQYAVVTTLLAVGFCYLIGVYGIGGVLMGKNLTPNAYEPLASFRILSDRPTFSLHGRDPDLLDPISVHMVELGGGGWSSAPIVKKANEQLYDLVILACSGGARDICNFRGVNFFAPPVVAALNENYSVFCTNSNAIVLVPRLRRVGVTPAMLAPALGEACATTFQGHTPDLLITRGTQ